MMAPTTYHDCKGQTVSVDRYEATSTPPPLTTLKASDHILFLQNPKTVDLKNTRKELNRKKKLSRIFQWNVFLDCCRAKQNRREKDNLKILIKWTTMKMDSEFCNFVFVVFIFCSEEFILNYSKILMT